MTSPLSAHTGWSAAGVGFNPLETLFFPFCLPMSQLRLCVPGRGCPDSGQSEPDTLPQMPSDCPQCLDLLDLEQHQVFGEAFLFCPKSLPGGTQFLRARL